ncbi:MAG: hypothetical protein MZW92_74700 [Comamonadaceae bacterium]|nr:hypothetical protein [Comamonadaceae bacterium]
MDLIRHYWDAVVLLQGDSGGRDQGEALRSAARTRWPPAFAAAGCGGSIPSASSCRCASPTSTTTGG